MTTKALIAAIVLAFAFGPASAKVDKQFPSNAIQPMITTGEEGGPSTKEDHPPPPPVARPKPKATDCTIPTDGMQSQDEGDRVACTPLAEPSGQSEIPQLRPFRPQSTQRYAP